MRLNELKKVTDIDAALAEKQRELSELYVKRARLMRQSVQLPKDQLSSEMNDEFMAHSMYEDLSSRWMKYGVKLPSLRTLKRRLIKARDVITELEGALPEYIGQFQVILVPPTKLLELPVSGKLRTTQLKGRGKKSAQSDVMHESLLKSDNHKTWTVLVALTSPSGLHRGQPLKILHDRSYMIGSLNARALGVAEYAAMTLLISEPVDTTTNTMLLKEYSEGKPVAVVSYQLDHYVFEVDGTGISGIFGDDRFRPAVEITK